MIIFVCVTIFQFEYTIKRKKHISASILFLGSFWWGELCLWKFWTMQKCLWMFWTMQCCLGKLERCSAVWERFERCRTVYESFEWCSAVYESLNGVVLSMKVLNDVVMSRNILNDAVLSSKDFWTMQCCLRKFGKDTLYCMKVWKNTMRPSKHWTIWCWLGKLYCRSRSIHCYF